jgi:HEAT repeat protein
MKPPLLGVLILTLLWSAGSAAGRDQSAAPLASRWAIVVGNDRDPIVARAQRDTVNVLEEQYGYRDRIVPILGAAATQANIRKQFLDTADRIRREDSLLVYFLLPTIEHKADIYFVPTDGREDSVWTLMAIDELNALIQKGRQRITLLISNSCADARALSARQRFQQQAGRGLWESAPVTTLNFCDVRTPDRGASQLATVLGTTLANPITDSGRFTAQELWRQIRIAVAASVPDARYDVQGERPLVDDGFVFVVERRRAPTLLNEINAARTADDQLRAIDRLVEIERSSREPESRRTVISGLVIAARNSAWTGVGRRRAIRALGDIGATEAIPDLAAVAIDQTLDAELRSSALEALGRIGTAAALPAMTRAFADPSPLVRGAAIRVAGAHPDLPSAMPIVARVGDNDADVRVAALQMIAVLARPATGGRNLITPIAGAARKAVETALTDSNVAVRREAVNAYGRLGVDLSRNPAILALLAKDQDEGVRTTIALTMGREYQGAANGATAGLDALISAADPSSPVAIRAAAMWSLGEIGDIRARPALTAGLGATDPRIREAAIEALGKMGAPDAIFNIVALLSDESPRVRLAAARMLATIGGRQANDALTNRIKSEPDVYVRQAIEEALLKFPPPSLAWIADAVTDDSPLVRLGVIERLAQVKEPAAAQYAIRAMTDPDISVRQAALKAVVDHMPGWFDPVGVALSSPETAIRFNAALALGQVGGRVNAGNVLLDRFNREQTALVKTQIVATLGTVTPPSMAIETALRSAALDTNPMLRAAAALSLGSYATAVDILKPLSSDEESIVRDAAIQSLRRILK